MTTIPYLEGPEFDDEDDDLVSLTSIFNEIKSKLKIEKGIFSLINLIKDCNNLSLTIVGAEKNFGKNFENV